MFIPNARHERSVKDRESSLSQSLAGLFVMKSLDKLSSHKPFPKEKPGPYVPVRSHASLSRAAASSSSVPSSSNSNGGPSTLRKASSYQPESDKMISNRALRRRRCLTPPPSHSPETLEEVPVSNSESSRTQKMPEARTYMDMSTQSQSPLLRLPRDIRIRIYEEVLLGHRREGGGAFIHIVRRGDRMGHIVCTPENREEGQGEGQGQIDESEALPPIYTSEDPLPVYTSETTPTPISDPDSIYTHLIASAQDFNDLCRTRLCGSERVQARSHARVQRPELAFSRRSRDVDRPGDEEEDINAVLNRARHAFRNSPDSYSLEHLGNLTPLLQTCRAIYAEASPLLSSRDDFTFEFSAIEELISFSVALSPRALDSIRQVVLNLRFDLHKHFNEGTFQSDTPRWERMWRVLGSMKSLKTLRARIVWSEAGLTEMQERRALEPAGVVRGLEVFEIRLRGCRVGRGEMEGIVSAEEWWRGVEEVPYVVVRDEMVLE